MREDLAVLRALIDVALDRDAHTRNLRAATAILVERKRRLAELELQELTAPRRSSVRSSE